MILDDTTAAAKAGRLTASRREVHATNGVDRRRCPNAKVATHERRGALACQLGDQLSDEFGVLGVEVLATERVGELEELLDVMPERRGDSKRFVCVHLGHEDALPRRRRSRQAILTASFPSVDAARATRVTRRVRDEPPHRARRCTPSSFTSRGALRERRGAPRPGATRSGRTTDRQAESHDRGGCRSRGRSGPVR